MSPVNQYDLMQGWEAATRLHIHADRGHLTEDIFSRRLDYRASLH